MAIVTLPVPESINGGIIPDETRVRVEALPHRNLVWDGTASEAVSIPLDPGKYVVCMTKAIDQNNIWMQQFEFLHKVTEDQFEVLQRLRPQRAKARQTSDGTVMMTCGMGLDCKKKTTSTVEMILHEAQHLGLSKDELLDPKNHADIQLLLQSKQANRMDPAPGPQKTI